jgi:hypothetical protein
MVYNAICTDGKTGKLTLLLMVTSMTQDKYDIVKYAPLKLHYFSANENGEAFQYFDFEQHCEEKQLEWDLLN